MKIVLRCYGINPKAINIVTDATDASIIKHKDRIVIESSNEIIERLTINRRSIYNSWLCYLNILNPIYYMYLYRLKNDEVYFYDDGFLWADIILGEKANTNLNFKVINLVRQINGSQVSSYDIVTCNSNNKIRIIYHKMPQPPILRYKITNIAAQAFWPLIISALIIGQSIADQENIFLTCIAATIIIAMSVARMFKFYHSQSSEYFINKKK